MKSTWRSTVVDFAALNSREIEEVDVEMQHYMELYNDDQAAAQWEKEMNSGTWLNID